MKCTDFELQLQRLFDERGTLDGDVELQAHALTCAECQSLVETYELLFDGVKAHAAERRELEVGCVELAGSASPSIESVASPSRRIMPWVAAAAVLLAVGWTAQTLQQTVADRGENNESARHNIALVPVAQPESVLTPTSTPTELTVSPQVDTAVPALQLATDVPPAEPALVAEESDPIGLSFLESPADEYAGLYRATGRSLAVMLRSIRPLHTDSALVEPVHEDPAGRSWRRLHNSIEPLTDSMTEALEGLLRGKPATPPAATADRAS
jgi:hypothetical protein